MVIKQEITGVIHKNRGRENNRKISAMKINKMEKIVKERYHDFGPTFASEKLKEDHQMKIGDETLRHFG